MPFCPKCGNQYQDEAQFCPKCGNAITPNDGNAVAQNSGNATAESEKICLINGYGLWRVFRYLE